MNKKELIGAIAKKTGFNMEEVELVLDATVETIE